MASTSPHERIIERFHEERGPYNTDEDEETAEFSQLSRRHTSDGKAQSNVHRSASMNDLTDPESVPSMLVVPGFRTESMNPLHRAVSVEGSLNTPNKDNKENFAVPQDPPAGNKKLLKQSSSSGRKILNAQNSKTS